MMVVGRSGRSSKQMNPLDPCCVTRNDPTEVESVPDSPARIVVAFPPMRVEALLERGMNERRDPPTEEIEDGDVDHRGSRDAKPDLWHA